MKKNFTTLILVVLLVIASFLLGSLWTKSKAPKEQTRQVEPSPAVAGEQQPKEQLPTTIGNFLVTKEEICKEDGKPIIYYFGASFCPHCKWEKPVVEKVMKKFGNFVSFHNNMDKQEADKEIWGKYSQVNEGGYIPFLVFGCKYARVGSGEDAGEVEEEKNLTALICKLTEEKPEKVCKE